MSYTKTTAKLTDPVNDEANFLVSHLIPSEAVDCLLQV